MKILVAFATRLLVVTLSVALAVVPTLAAAEEPAFARTSGQPASVLAGSPESAGSFHAFSQLAGVEQRALMPLTDAELAAIEGGNILLGALLAGAAIAFIGFTIWYINSDYCC